jgi:hypothetical protein
MAYKLFSTGEVLTAANVNSYLMNQTVMVFATAAARTTALSGVLAEGMISYRSDAKVLEIYNGTTWITESSFTSPLTTKGDVHTYSTTDARLPVGSDGQTLVANSSAATGLAWAGPTFAAGKNKIINGDFGINQRNFTSNTTGVYGFDRWAQAFSGGTSVTNSAQTFTLGTAPVVGYESKNFCRQVTVGQSAASDYAQIKQPIESVRTLANQTTNISFWAKAGTGTPKISVELQQSFGTGGSPSSAVLTNAGSVTLSTAWVRYSLTVAIPSITGATLGTNNDDALILALWTSAGSTYSSRTSSIGVQNNTFDIWGVQVEAGSVATAFQTATGTIQGELAACQRYYYRITSPVYSGANIAMSNYGSAATTTAIGVTVPQTVSMRTAPASIDYSSNIIISPDELNSSIAVSALTLSSFSNTNNLSVLATVTGATQYRPYRLYGTTTSTYLGFSAEL